MERIADIFGQGLFMISRDVLTMMVVSGMMLFMNWQLSLIVFLMMPVILYATKLFQKYMKKAFEEVRTGNFEPQFLCSGTRYRNEDIATSYKRRHRIREVQGN